MSTKQQHDLIQGSKTWHEFRLKYRGASEASAMLGLSPYKTRSELLYEKQTGITPPVDAMTQRVFDKGHQIEALARIFAEEFISDDLYPVVCSKGWLSASCDGLTMDDTIAWECKQYNADDYKLVEVGELPSKHWPQCQQVLYVTEAEKLLFTISDGSKENTAHVWVYPNLEQQQTIIEGWKKFEEDLEVYEPVKHQEKPIAEATEGFLTLSIRVNGELAIVSNLTRFGEQLREFISTMPQEPKDDQDFANLEASVKKLKEAEDALEQAETYALAQIADVNDMRKAVADLKELARANRLTSEKLVKTQKELIKLNVLNGARENFKSFINELSSGFKGVKLDIPEPDFGGAMKNKKTIASLHDAVDTLLANSKIEAELVAKDYQNKLAWCNETSKGYGFLFSDLQLLITKPREDFELTINSRIKEHQENERIKAEIAEKERIEREARIAQESAEKAVIAERERIAKEEAEIQQTLEQVAVVDKAPVKVDEPIKHRYNQDKPSRESLISAISLKYGVAYQLAEEWLVSEFSTKETKKKAA